MYFSNTAVKVIRRIEKLLLTKNGNKIWRVCNKVLLAQLLGNRFSYGDSKKYDFNLFILFYSNRLLLNNNLLWKNNFATVRKYRVFSNLKALNPLGQNIIRRLLTTFDIASLLKSHWRWWLCTNFFFNFSYFAPYMNKRWQNYITNTVSYFNKFLEQ